MAKPFDAVILGAGPGGLSTALALARLNLTCAVISNGKFRNEGVEATHAVLGHDHIHPQEIWARGREQIDRYGTATYADANVVSAEKLQNGQGFIVKSEDNRTWKGRALMLATGVKDLLPDLKGYAENWPRNIYQCPFCDGWERRDSEKAVLGVQSFGVMEIKMARMISNFDGDGPSKVTVLTNGNSLNSGDAAITKTYKALKSQGVKFDHRKVVELINAEPEEGVDVVFEGGEKQRFGFIMNKPPTAPNADHLIKQLGIETAPGMFGEIVKTNAPMQSTNVPGVFAAGDLGSSMTHVTVALSSGVSAAAGIINYLNDLIDEKMTVPEPTSLEA